MKNSLSLSLTFAAACSTLPALLTLQGCEAPDVAAFEHAATTAPDALPDYTEYGYNTAGANFSWNLNDEAVNYLWKISPPPSAYIEMANNNMLDFSITGATVTPDTRTAAMIAFSFTFLANISSPLTNIPELANSRHPTQQGNLSVALLTDIQKLANSRYSTQQGNLSVALLSDRHEYEGTKISSASLSFNRSRIIYADSKQLGVSLSGTFEVSGTTRNNISVTISSGRFDILFSGNNGTSFDNGIRQLE